MHYVTPLEWHSPGEQTVAPPKIWVRLMEKLQIIASSVLYLTEPKWIKSSGFPPVFIEKLRWIPLQKQASSRRDPFALAQNGRRGRRVFVDLPSCSGLQRNFYIMAPRSPTPHRTAPPIPRSTTSAGASGPTGARRPTAQRAPCHQAAPAPAPSYAGATASPVSAGASSLSSILPPPSANARAIILRCAWAWGVIWS
jgi:hypothetical protein